MGWPPTAVDMLHELDGASEYADKPDHGFGFVAGPGKGLAIYDPNYLAPLIDAEMVQKVPDCPDAYFLSEKGKEALQMLKGERRLSQFKQPDWLLIALTK